MTIDPPAGTTCEDVQVKAVSDMAFGDTFTLETPAAFVKASISGCELKLEPGGKIGVNARFDYSALMLVELDGERGIAAPVHVKIVPDAGNAGCGSGTCNWVYQSGSDSPDPCVLGG